VATVAERAKALLGNRAVRRRVGYLGQIEVEGTPVKGQQVWWVLDLRKRQCNCPAFLMSKASPNTCKHLEMADTLRATAQVFADAGVLA
jgi:hypothetical protein